MVIYISFACLHYRLNRAKIFKPEKRHLGDNKRRIYIENVNLYFCILVSKVIAYTLNTTRLICFTAGTLYGPQVSNIGINFNICGYESEVIIYKYVYLVIKKANVVAIIFYYPKFRINWIFPRRILMCEFSFLLNGLDLHLAMGVTWFTLYCWFFFLYKLWDICG